MTRIDKNWFPRIKVTDVIQVGDDCNMKFFSRSEYSIRINRHDLLCDLI